MINVTVLCRIICDECNSDSFECSEDEPNNVEHFIETSIDQAKRDGWK